VPRDDVKRLNQCRGHGNKLRAGQRQRPHRLRELDIIADQDADFQAIQLRHNQIIPGHEQFLFLGAVKMSLAVVGDSASRGMDQKCGIENPIAFPLG